jgi:hypothetical protein
MNPTDGGFYGMLVGLVVAFVGIWRAADSWTQFHLEYHPGHHRHGLRRFNYRQPDWLGAQVKNQTETLPEKPSGGDGGTASAGITMDGVTGRLPDA